ncbi:MULTISPECIES: SGNH/GDSL hydrolase family protein [unclassified Nocardioides]|uniref:SGNH/GDSL hydrolase family protein n=1 Tax=unclassified Nocardioides TaxID=2615069 RepID=UPI0007034FDA|nr:MULTISPECIES: SGNH/GDSL hydrolase family protein [unclassified Nocardioides]KRC52893.1 SGNH hydrolase [Nocardioides sp. Root79]KRC72423.1 SGNH hydrolase [Nocardioides sp. Root240]
MTFSKYVALGDSFTEGVGDPDPARPNGLRGWADRTAEALAADARAAGVDFGYANLAIRGRKLPAIIDEQVDAGLALGPDLVTIHGGGNDVLRPKVDLDDLAASYDEAIGRIAGSGAHVVVFTIADTGNSGMMKVIRGRTAIFNEWVREIAEKHGATLVDMWRMRGWTVAEVMDEDRLHLNAVGHQSIAIAALDALGVAHDLQPLPPVVVPVLSAREQRAADLAWARSHLAPWVQRRVTGRSSGDGVEPKRPALAPIG